MSRATRLGAAATVVSLLAVTSPAAGQVTRSDVDAAKRKVDALQEQADAIATQIEAAWEEAERLADRSDALAASLSATETSLRLARTRVQDVAVRLYMERATGGSLGLLMVPGSGGYQAAVQYLDEASSDTRQAVQGLVVAQQELDRVGAELETAKGTQAEASARLETLAAQIQDRLTAARADYDRLVALRRRQEEAARKAAEEAARKAAEEAARKAAEEAARRATSTTSPPRTTSTTAPSAAQASGGTCPVAGPASFVDSFGAPRSGGRHHEGVDMMAARGTPAVAAFAGTVKRVRHNRLGGNTVWLRSSAGDEFYYAHLDSYATGLKAGMSVTAGAVLGYVGTTGNAPPNLPHLHWEYHPGGGAAVDPYPLARSLCR